MHEYMTRHMVALQPMTYADMIYEVGDLFLATPVDEPYLTRAGRARPAAAADMQAAAPVVAPPPPEEPPPPAPVVEAAAPDEPAAVAEHAEPEVVAAAEAEPEAKARRTYTRRNQASSAS